MQTSTMNIDKFKEILNCSTHVDVTGDYEIRRYYDSGGYIIIDGLGDFIILAEDEVNEICGIIFEDLINKQTIQIN